MVIDIEAKEYTNGPIFAEKQKRTRPDHGKYYCHHGAYIGSLKLLSKCERCVKATIDFIANN